MSDGIVYKLKIVNIDKNKSKRSFVVTRCDCIKYINQGVLVSQSGQIVVICYVFQFFLSLLDLIDIRMRWHQSYRISGFIVQNCPSQKYPFPITSFCLEPILELVPLGDSFEIPVKNSCKLPLILLVYYILPWTHMLKFLPWVTRKIYPSFGKSIIIILKIPINKSIIGSIYCKPVPLLTLLQAFFY